MMTTFIGLQQIGGLCFDQHSRAKIISAARSSFTHAGTCPHCKKNNMQGMPILEAEKKGIVVINSDSIRQMAQKHETQFVLCPDCGWWGYPDKK